MILINLLPHREARRRQRKKNFYIALGASAVGGLLVVGAWFAVLAELKSVQESRNNYIKTEITRLEAQIKDIAALRSEIEALKARQKAVEDLQLDRNTPVHLLDDLVKQTPEGVYLRSIKQTGMVVAVTGMAQTNERVSEFLRNTTYSANWLEKPELVEIKAANVGAPGQGRRLYEFSMRLTLKRVKAPEAASVPASGPAPARKA